MDILEAYDLTGCPHTAAHLYRVDPDARPYVAVRAAGSAGKSAPPCREVEEVGSPSTAGVVQGSPSAGK